MRDLSRAYRPDIDGLRALAVVLVIAFHAFPSVFRGGFVGVDVFFVISGYLITSLIRADLATGTFALRDFLARRFRRLLPALTLVLATVMALGALVLWPGDYGRLGLEVLASATFTANLLFWSQAGYFDGDAHLKPLLPLWSLGVEEQFYLIWAPVMVLLARLRALPLLLALMAASFAVNVLIISRYPAAAFYLLPTRLWELLLGAALTYAAAAPARLAAPAAWAGLALVLLSAAALVAAETPYPGWHALMPTIGTALFIWAGQKSFLNRIFSYRWLVLVGLISYPLYLWHWPLLSLAHISRGIAPPALSKLALVATACLLAWLTYKYVELPIRSRTQTARRLRYAAVTLCAVALGLGGTGYAIVAQEGFPGRFPAELRARLFIPDDQQSIHHEYRVATCFPSTPELAINLPVTCLPEHPDVLILGDSHAVHLYPGFSGLQSDYVISVAQLTAPVCPPILASPLPRLKNCVAISNIFFEKISQLQPRHVVVSANALNPDYVRHLPEALTRLKEIGVPNIHLLGPVPYWRLPLRHSLFRFYLLHGRIPDRMNHGIDERFSAADMQLERMAKSFGVYYASPRSALCDADGCMTFTSEGNLMAWNGPYLTIEGSRILVKKLFGHLGQKPQ